MSQTILNAAKFIQDFLISVLENIRKKLNEIWKNDLAEKKALRATPEKGCNLRKIIRIWDRKEAKKWKKTKVFIV